MKAKLKITFKDTKSSANVIDVIEKKYESLRRKHGDIIRCSVVLDLPHRKSGESAHYRVTVNLKVPGMELVGRSRNRRQGGGDMMKGVGEAFAAVNAQLEHRALHKNAAQHSRRSVPDLGILAESLYAA